jgi:hypothetical protein
VTGVRPRRGTYTLVEHHRDVGTQLELDVDGAFGGEHVQRAIEVRAELSPVFGYPARAGEAEDLIAATVGQDRPRPPHELVKTATARDQAVARFEVEVIRVAEDDLRAKIREVALRDCLDRSTRTNRHECRRLDDAVRRRQLAATRATVAMKDAKLKRMRHAFQG